jgi:bilirubin oxidase
MEDSMRRALVVGLLGACVGLGCSSTTTSANAPGDDGGVDAAGDATDETGAESGGSSAHNPLWIPDSLSGTSFHLTLGASTKQLMSGAATKTYGYNGASFWGPTLILNKGDLVHVDVTNALTEETTTHWHGLHVPADADGNPHQPIAAGATWSPSFEVKNEAATFWYHPHVHMMTQEQLTYGAGGFIIVRDAQEAALALPRTYGVDDVPLVLTSRRFSSGNQFDLTTAYGDYLLANGTLHAKVDLPAQVVRLRVLNGEIERAYDLGFDDGRTFYVIGNDGGLLNAPVPVTRVKLYTGERLELLVDLSKDAVGKSVTLRSFNGGQTFGFPGGEPGTTGGFGSLLNDTTFDVLRVDVTAAKAGAITAIPATLAHHTYWTDADVTHSRTIAITDKGPGTPFTFDGASYDPAVINQTVGLNAVEKWTVSNGATFDHAFHIHDVQFKIVARSAGSVGAYEGGWKDTVIVPRNESVSFIAKFDDFASATTPYMYHCHMSNHEDGGLMGQFLVE